MTDCSQLQALLDQSKQQRQVLDDDPETYCQNQCPPGDVGCIKECAKSIPGRKQALDQEIAKLQARVENCSALVGTWMITVDGAVEASGHYVGQFTIESWDDQTQTWSGTMSLPNGEPEPRIAPTAIISVTYPFTGARGDIPPSAHWIAMRRPINTYPAEVYSGSVNVSAQPLTMDGKMDIDLGPDQVGIPKVYSWSAQKLP